MKLFRRDTIGKDATAGLVLGVESVPDGLASGLLAGVNPVFGLYAYMVGTVAGAALTSSTFMAVQATGAMSILVADVDVVHKGPDATTALFTLSLLTGIAMVAAGLFKLGKLLRFVSQSVMVGFISAVGINIVLGQLSNFTGYSGNGANRVVRAIDTVLHVGDWSSHMAIIGFATVALILVLERTPLGAMGMVLAIALTSALAVALGWGDVVTVGDIADIPRSLPMPQWPTLEHIGELIVPAISLAFVGLIQGAGISANFPNPDGTYPEPSRDFVGQGAANIATGFLSGMPVGGSMSATSLIKQAGARTKMAHFIAGIVMALVILLFGPAVDYVAMPALAALLILIGVRTVKIPAIEAVLRLGNVQKAVFGVTFALTLVIPLQYAVLVGVGLSVILHVVRQSHQLTIMEWELDEQGVLERPAPAQIAAHTVVVLQPYGNLFFASAPTLEKALPEITPETVGSVVILRIRGVSDLGGTVIGVLKRYAEQLDSQDSKLVLVSASERVIDQLRVTGMFDVLGDEDVYPTDERVGVTVRRAHDDAHAWVAARQN